MYLDINMYLLGNDNYEAEGATSYSYALYAYALCCGGPSYPSAPPLAPSLCLFMQTCMEDYIKPYKKNIDNTNLTQYNKTIVTAKMMTIKMHMFYKHVAL
jgi:hypothetical protein